MGANENTYYILQIIRFSLIPFNYLRILYGTVALTKPATTPDLIGGSGQPSSSIGNLGAIHCQRDNVHQTIFAKQ